MAKVINGRFLEGLRPGTVTVTATTANGLSCSFTVTVAELSAVKVQAPPDKTSYEAGEPLDTTGLEVSWCFADGAEAPAERYLLVGYDPDKPGEQTIDVGLGDIWTTFTVQVAEPLSGEIQDDLRWTLSYGNTIRVQGTLDHYNQFYVASYNTAGKMIAIGLIDFDSKVVYAHPDAAQIKLFLTRRFSYPAFTPRLEHPIIIPLDKTA